MSKPKQVGIIAILLTMVVSVMGTTAASASTTTSAGTTFTATTSLTDTSSDFYFSGSMSEQVLKNYLSRAVTFQGLCAESGDNLLIDEDIRMLLRTGAKFVSRAALFAWVCTSAAQMEKHFEYAETNAKKVHDADPEIILQGFVAEIVRKSVVNSVAIPAWVFEAFGKQPEDRCFVFEDIIDDSKGANYWAANAGYPDWSKEETMMWYYYCICRYIDIGYESIHIQEGADTSEYANVDKVLTMSREYAKTHARRSIVLFHSFFSMTTGGNKIGNRLLFDIQGNGLVPNETVEEDGALKCRIGTPDDFWCTWIGRSNGGEHPLGFTCDVCPTIMEFDNYGQQGELGVSNGENFGTWGYDDITWFATQPEWYRNEFLLYIEDYTSTHCLDNGDCAYFILFPMRRCLTADPHFPTTTYTLTSSSSLEFVMDYCDGDSILYEILDGLTMKYTTKGYYMANRQSDGCPNGFNQEDTIRKIFLGDNAPENPEYTQVILPGKYAVATSAKTGGQTTAVTTVHAEETSTKEASSEESSSGETELASSVTDTDSTSASVQAAVAEGEASPESAESTPETSSRSILPLLITVLVFLAAAGTGIFYLIRKKCRQ